MILKKSPNRHRRLCHNFFLIPLIAIEAGHLDTGLKFFVTFETLQSFFIFRNSRTQTFYLKYYMLLRAY